MRYIPGFDRNHSLGIVHRVASTIRDIGNIGLLSMSPNRTAGHAIMAFINRPSSIIRTTFETMNGTTRLVSVHRRRNTRPHVNTASMLPVIPIDNVALRRYTRVSHRLTGHVTSRLGVPYCYCRTTTFGPRHGGLTIYHGNRCRNVTRHVSSSTRTPSFNEHPFSRRITHANYAIMKTHSFLVTIGFGLGAASAHHTGTVTFSIHRGNHPVHRNGPVANGGLYCTSNAPVVGPNALGYAGTVK